MGRGVHSARTLLFEAATFDAANCSWRALFVLALFVLRCFQLATDGGFHLAIFILILQISPQRIRPPSFSRGSGVAIIMAESGAARNGPSIIPVITYSIDLDPGPVTCHHPRRQLGFPLRSVPPFRPGQHHPLHTSHAMPCHAGHPHLHSRSGLSGEPT